MATMRAQYLQNLREDALQLADGLAIARLYGSLTQEEKDEAHRLTDAIERFEERVLHT